MVVKDILIVAIGDSYASGEGNPVVHGSFGFEAPQWAYSPDPAMELENANAHRSTIAARHSSPTISRSEHPHEAVTFVSVADSGATIEQGLLGPMPSIGDPKLHRCRPNLRGAADRRLASDQRLDRFVGADDIGFATRVPQLIDNTLYDFPTQAPSSRR